MTDALPWDQFVQQPPVTTYQAEAVVIIGAGLAGCWMARTLAATGIKVVVLEAGASAASGASSNPVGIAKPFVTRSPSLAMNFYLKAHRYLREQLHHWSLAADCMYSDCGVVQLVDKPYAKSQNFDNLAQREMQDILNMPYGGHGLHFADAGWLNPSALCQCLLAHEQIELRTNSQVQAIEPDDQLRWRVNLSDETFVPSNHIVIANGAALATLDLSNHLDIVPARGQITRFALDKHTQAPTQVISGKQYLIPDGNSVVVGATFQRECEDASVITDDDEQNRIGLADMLPQLKIEAAIDSYAGIRGTTPDRLPLVGPLSDPSACASAYADLHHGRKLADYPALPIHTGLFVLGGLGSRGIVTAPLAACLLADYMSGGERIAEWASLINPARFQIRRLKRRAVA